MSLYLKQIEQLISLQKVDDQIHSIQNELALAPLELENLRKEFEEVSARRERQADKMAHLHEQEKRLGIEIEDEMARIKKSKNKMMQAGNSKEYNAMMREMDSLERMNKDREQEKTTLIEELTTQIEVQKELDAKYAELASAIEECSASLDKRTEKARSEEVALQQTRLECAKEVPQRVFERYEFIRNRLSHPVIVPVKAGVCSGCHIAIPPQSFIELQKGAQILSCPNCQRLMYWVEHFHPAEEAAEPVKQETEEAATEE